jgi:hypothetical protein
MFLKTVVAVTLLTSSLSAADLFSVRSFTQPDTKARIPVDGKLFSMNQEDLKRIVASLKVPDIRECSIPLLTVKTPKTNDKIAQFSGPNSNPDPGSTIAPPVPACTEPGAPHSKVNWH